MTQIASLLAALFALAALAVGAGMLLTADRGFNTRLTARAGSGRHGAAEPEALRAKVTPALVKLMTRWGETAGKGALENERRVQLRVQLIQAGFYSDRAVEAYFGLRVAGVAVLGPLGALLGVLLHLQGPAAVIGPMMLGANIGFMLPKILLANRIKERKLAMQLGLPDAIDLMVVAVEAGATLNAAIQRLVREFRELHPVVAEQFSIMMTETQAGASRSEALTRLAHRSPSEEVASLSTMLIQSEAVGASIGGALRVFSEELRKNRFLEAERKATELPVKLAFPLVFCIFPCLSAVIFIPVAIQAYRTVLNG